MISASIFFALSCMFIFSDFYYQGVGRPFDYIAIFLLLMIFLLNRDIFKSVVIISRKTIILLLIIMPWVIYGALFNDSLLAALSMILGISLILPITFGLFTQKLTSIIEMQIKVMIVVSVIFLLMQILLYYGTGIFVDIPGSFGSIESRGLNVGLNYFRPSGLYQEPNAYCVATFCLLTACAFFKKRNIYIEISAIISIFLTQSLWGFGGIFILIYLLYGFKSLLKFVFLMLFLIGIFVLIFKIDFLSLAETSITFNRIININDDASRQARFGSTQELDINITYLIGGGVDVVNFQSIAANAFAFLLYSFGFLGLLIIFLYISYMVNFNMKILIAVGFLLTAFPHFSYMFFWSWLGIIFSLANTQRLDARLL